jgi:serine/threonine protein kinase
MKEPRLLFWRSKVSQQDRTIAATVQLETFGKYILLKRLAAGGMAEVFLARPASSDGNGRVQVVKRILPHVADQPMFVDMFRSEIQVIMGFNHPHTVALHDSGEWGKQPFIAMEYIEGKSLKEIMGKFNESKTQMAVPMALGLMAQAAAGLNYAHTFVNKVTDEAVNAVHRDISPHNLMVTYEGNLKVIDFGIAKAAVRMNEATRAGTIKGKMAYLSPEQLTGQAVDARTDIFALGIVAWELLTMRRAFINDGDSEITVISRIDNVEKHLIAPSLINRDVPAEVDAVILKALKKNPDDRYQSAKEFQSALRKVMQAFYPNYTYADTGQKLSQIFAYEIECERKELRDLNVMAQMRLVNKSAQTPRFVPDKPGQGALAHLPAQSGAQNFTTQQAVDIRLGEIEKIMRQNASTRHYVWLAFYVLALVTLQLEGRYSIFTYLIPVPEVKMAMAEPLPATKTAPKAAPVQKTAPGATMTPGQESTTTSARNDSAHPAAQGSLAKVQPQTPQNPPSPAALSGNSRATLRVQPSHIQAAKLIKAAAAKQLGVKAAPTVTASGRAPASVQGRLLSRVETLAAVRAPSNGLSQKRTLTTVTTVSSPKKASSGGASSSKAVSASGSLKAVPRK